MAGISRRGEGGWDGDGWALVVARRSWASQSPLRAATRAPTLYLSPRQDAQLLSRPYAPDRVYGRFLFLLLLRLMPIGRDKSAPTAFPQVFHTAKSAHPGISYSQKRASD